MKKLKTERIIFIICIIVCLVALVISGLEVEALERKINELEFQIKNQVSKLEVQAALLEMQHIMIETQDKLIIDLAEGSKTKEVSLGEFEITYYCPCVECCGKTDGITASGTLAREGQTVAADWDMLPPGTEIYIEGIGYRTVEDKGGAIKGNRLDVFMDSHSAALDAGVAKTKVYMEVEVD